MTALPKTDLEFVVLKISTATMNHDHMHMAGMTTGVMDTTTMDHNMMNHGSMAGGSGGHDMSGMSLNGMNMGNMTMKCGEGMMMMMYFHSGHCEYVLFKEILVSTEAQMAGACIIIFLLAFFYEGLKVFREFLLRRALTPNYRSEINISKYSQSQDTMVIDPQSAKANGSGYLPLREIARTHIISSAHFIQTVLHILQVFISYLLMLVFMNYNVWLCLAVVLGAGAGYFLFGWKRAIVVDVNEHCH